MRPFSAMQLKKGDAVYYHHKIATSKFETIPAKVIRISRARLRVLISGNFPESEENVEKWVSPMNLKRQEDNE